jgi:4-hydroxy-2-oxoheptanedioate aldolase
MASPMVSDAGRSAGESRRSVRPRRVPVGMLTPTTRDEFGRRVRAGERCAGAFLDLGSAVGAEVVAGAGFDYVVVDLEHGYGGRETTVAQLQALASTPAAPLVRVPSAARVDLVSWALDMGAAGVVVPRVETVEETRAAQEATRYSARRGAAPGARAAGFGRDAAYRGAADEQRLLVIQIETAEALAAADEIAAVDGVDVLFVGPADLARTLGVDGGPGHPEMLGAARAVAAAAGGASKVAGVYLDDPGLARAYAEPGFTMFASGFESGLLAGAADARIAALREALS